MGEKTLMWETLSMALQPIVGPWPLFSFLIYTQSVGLPGRGISPSQGRYLHTEQHQYRINAQTSHPCLGWDSLRKKTMEGHY
jgi:hypothetical protein